MSRRLTVFSVAISLLAAAPMAYSADLSGLQLVQDEQGTRALVEVDALSGYKVFTLANPDRLVLDLSDARLKPGVQMPGPNGVVAGVRTGQPSPGTLRLVFDLGGPVRNQSQVERDGNHTRLTLLLSQSGAAPALATKPARAPIPVSAPVVNTTRNTAPSNFARIPAASESRAPIPVSTPTALPEMEPAIVTPMPGSSPVAQMSAPEERIPAPARAEPENIAPLAAPAPTREKPRPSSTAPTHVAKSVKDLVGSGQRKIVVAIDAGHGGKDPGAHGPSGVREKNVTLAGARDLARQINADPGSRAGLIRDGDVFVPLKSRYMKARAAQADLFISIHADASPNDTANGASVFVLSTRGATSQAARWLADQENAADLVGGVSLDEKDPGLAAVLFDLSQSATMRASDDLANSVLASLKNVGKAHKTAIERANFVVLRSPDVPSMLVETGFITNPGEEQRLNDADYRNRLAAAIKGGVRKYFTEMAPPGTWYASRRGDAGGNGGSELVAASPE